MVLRFPFTEFVKALYTRLDTELVLTPKPLVFSFSAPMDAVAPYVVISQLVFVPVGSKTHSDGDLTCTVSVFGLEGQLGYVNSCMQEVIRAITRAELVMGDGFEECYGMGKLESGAEVLPYFEETEGVVLVQGVIRYTWRIEDHTP